jgi:hypothetical protein
MIFSTEALMKNSRSWVVFLLGILLGVVSVFFVIKWFGQGQSRDATNLIAGIVSALSSAGLILKEIIVIFKKETDQTNELSKESTNLAARGKKEVVGVQNVMEGDARDSQIHQEINIVSPKRPTKKTANPKAIKKKTGRNSAKRVFLKSNCSQSEHTANAGNIND